MPTVTRGIWRPEFEERLQSVSGKPRPASPAADAPLIGVCSACGYLGYCEERASDRRQHARILVCEECRGVERKPASRESGNHRKAAAA